MATPILGVSIDTVTQAEALDKAMSFLVSGQHTIFTPNPEMLVKAQSDNYFKTVLNQGDLNLCDGFGLWLAVKLFQKKGGGNKSPLGRGVPRNEGRGGSTSSSAPTSTHPGSLELTTPPKRGFERIAGVDFMLELCCLAAEQGKGVFLLGCLKTDAAKQTADVLVKSFPALKIAGFSRGYAVSERDDGQLEYNKEDNDRLISEINLAKPDILFVAFGMGKQEKWIVENLPKMPSVRVAMGVGGSFDYISGRIPRAPLLMRRLGLEWLYRLLVQPARFKRIFNATIRFTWLFFRSR